jgi:hypothetical protein
MDQLHDRIASGGESADTFDYSNVLRIHNRCSLTEGLVVVQSLENAKTGPSGPPPADKSGGAAAKTGPTPDNPPPK